MVDVSDIENRQFHMVLLYDFRSLIREQIQIVKLLDKNKLRRLSLTTDNFNMDCSSSFSNKTYSEMKRNMAMGGQLERIQQTIKEILNTFIEYMDEIKQFSKLRYLQIQAPNHSILTHSAISDAICEKSELEYLQIEFLRNKL